MGIFDNFPYTNVHELNTDWLVKTVKEVKDKTDVIDNAVTEAKDYAADASQSKDTAVQAAEDAENAKAAAVQAYDDIVDFTSGLAGQVRTNTENIAVQTARIDTIISGSTPDANVELLDIRVAADGTTYPTAGDAVRGQATDLYNMALGLCNTLCDIPMTMFVHSSYIDTSETYHNSNRYAVMFQTYLPFPVHIVSSDPNVEFNFVDVAAGTQTSYMTEYFSTEGLQNVYMNMRTVNSDPFELTELGHMWGKKNPI